MCCRTIAIVQPAAAAQPAANQAPPHFSRSAFRALLILTAIQHLLWLPEVLWGINYALRLWKFKFYKTGTFWVIWLGQCNTVADFITYSATQKSFRRALKSLCRDSVNFLCSHLAGRDFFGTPVVQFQGQDTVSQNATVGQSNDMSGEAFPLQDMSHLQPQPAQSSTVAETPAATPETAVARGHSTGAAAPDPGTAVAGRHTTRIAAPAPGTAVAGRHTARMEAASAPGIAMDGGHSTRAAAAPTPLTAVAGGHSTGPAAPGTTVAGRHSTTSVAPAPAPSATSADPPDTERPPIELFDIVIDPTPPN
ncbi:Hypp1159 [Branchiostoma lanceolatum]|uniref:Hypp1159 protein n=1 Tax=Branchiostoma lanceolatum TaxID=7740 RepID=A0A8J9ZH55_BRALA|nr:Hypp1159 [Branchiostoma lanceolatum]